MFSTYCIIYGVSYQTYRTQLLFLFLRKIRTAVSLQTADDKPFCQIVKYCKNRDTDQDADESENTAEKGDGKQNPETGQTDAVGKDFGADNVAVNLLQNDNEKQENQTVLRAVDQNQQCSRNGTDKRTEIGDDVGHTNDHTDQDHIGKCGKQ